MSWAVLTDLFKTTRARREKSVTFFKFSGALQVVKAITKFLRRLGPKLLCCFSCLVDHMYSEACPLSQLHQLPMCLRRQQQGLNFQTNLISFSDQKNWRQSLSYSFKHHPDFSVKRKLSSLLSIIKTQLSSTYYSLGSSHRSGYRILTLTMWLP